MKTPMSSDTKLMKDKECESVDSTKYRSMIEAPKISHLEVVKRIFRYIKGTTHLGLWYPKGTSIETVVYADSDHAGDYVDRKSTSCICTFRGFVFEIQVSRRNTTVLAINPLAEEAYTPIESSKLSYKKGQMFVEFVIQNQLFSYSLKEFAQIFNVPCEGACVFSDIWRIDELAYGIPSDGPYQNNLPPIEDIISSIRVNRDGQVHRIIHEEEIDVLEYQVLTREIEPTLKPLEEIIWENFFCMRGYSRDHVPACLCYMLYCVVHSEKFNLAYYMAKRMEWVTKQPRLLLPYGMLLTRLFTFIMSEYPELSNDSYILYDRVMTPLVTQLA
ncbi:hypothetical protein Tco_1311820 [Tanacetum coccineum]